MINLEKYKNKLTRKGKEYWKKQNLENLILSPCIFKLHNELSFLVESASSFRKFDFWVIPPAESLKSKSFKSGFAR